MDAVAESGASSYRAKFGAHCQAPREVCRAPKSHWIPPLRPSWKLFPGGGSKTRCPVQREFLKKGGPRDPNRYRGIIRGLYRASLRDYIGVILRNTPVMDHLLIGHREFFYIGCSWPVCSILESQTAETRGDFRNACKSAHVKKFALHFEQNVCLKAWLSSLREVLSKS